MAVGQYPLCSDCTMFVKCIGGVSGTTGALFTCPSSLFYDVSRGVCDFGGLVTCGYDLNDLTFLNIAE